MSLGEFSFFLGTKLASVYPEDTGGSWQTLGISELSNHRIDSHRSVGSHDEYSLEEMY